VKDRVLKIAGNMAASSPMKEEATGVYVEAFRPAGFDRRQRGHPDD
jgi:hypothetical protein